MRNIIMIKFREYKRSIPSIIVMTIMTILFIYVFGIGFKTVSVPTVKVIDNDNSFQSKEFIQRLFKNQEFNFIEATNFEEIEEEIKNSKIFSAIEINTGFIDDVNKNIIIYKGSESLNQYKLEMHINEEISSYINDIEFIRYFENLYDNQSIEYKKDELKMALEENASSNNSLIIETSIYNTNSTKGYDSVVHSFIGFLIFFSMFTMVFGIGSIVEEREWNIWQRLKVSPVPERTILMGNFIANVIIGGIQVGLSILISKYLFNIDLGTSTLGLLIVLLGFILATTSLGLLWALVVKSHQQLSTILPIVVVSTSMLGGCMWPIEIIKSPIIRNMSYITPQRWAIIGMEKIIIYNNEAIDILKQFLVLVGMSVLLLVITYFISKASKEL